MGELPEYDAHRAAPFILITVVGADDGYFDPLMGQPFYGRLCAPKPDKSSLVTVPIADPAEAFDDGNCINEGYSDRVMKIYNFRDNIPVVGHRYICYRLGRNMYFIDNQATFMEYAGS